jgi:hypothetical protein
MPQLLSQLVHLQLETENAELPGVHRTEINTRYGDRIPYILLQRHFPVPPRLAPVLDARRGRIGGWLHHGRRLGVGPPLALLHHLKQREREQTKTKFEFRQSKTSAGVGTDQTQRTTKFELLSTATDPTEPISDSWQNRPAKFGSEKHRRTECGAHNRTKQSSLAEKILNCSNRSVQEQGSWSRSTEFVSLEDTKSEQG